MLFGATRELDLIEELKLRRWARENYCPATERERHWHPVIHDEMHARDREALRETPQNPHREH